MSRLFGYYSDHTGPILDAVRLAGLAAALGEVPRPLSLGLGFSHGTQILLKRRPRLTDTELDLSEVAKDVRTNALLVHARGPVGAVSTVEDTQPFRHGPWMYAQGEGVMPSSPALQDALRRTLTDALLHSVQGRNDAELFFHLVLSHLRDAGIPPMSWTAPADKVVAAVRAALAHWRRVARETAGGDAVSVAALLTNGQTFYALALGRPLWFAGVRRVNGELRRAEAQDARGFVFLSGVTPPDEGAWGVVETGSAVWLDASLKLQRLPLEDRA